MRGYLGGAQIGLVLVLSFKVDSLMTIQCVQLYIHCINVVYALLGAVSVVVASNNLCDYFLLCRIRKLWFKYNLKKVHRVLYLVA